jgi:hypothetical protein
MRKGANSHFIVTEFEEVESSEPPFGFVRGVFAASLLHPINAMRQFASYLLSSPTQNCSMVSRMKIIIIITTTTTNTTTTNQTTRHEMEGHLAFLQSGEITKVEADECSRSALQTV